VSVPVVVAVDAGTTGVRAATFDESGLPLAWAYRELTQHYPLPGWVEHDAEEIWSAVEACIAEVTAGHAVAVVGLTNQRETVVAWDRRTGRPLHRAIVWQDRRTADTCRALADDGHLPFVRERTGLVLDPYFSATKVAWLLGPGGVEPGPDLAVGTVDAWLLWKLTGEHLTDVTNASRTALFDIRSQRWSEELCELFGVPPEVLPEVRPSIGSFGASVHGVAGDQQAALFGQACFEPGMAKNTYGTGSFVLMNVGQSCPEPVPGLLTTIAWGDAGGVTYALEGSIFATGAAVQWLRDALGIIPDAAAIEPLAASVDSTDGVYVVPAFSGLGSPWWDPYARGAIVGITRGTGRAQLARAVLESIAFQTRDVVETMVAATGQPLRTLRVDGGASANQLLLQLQADQLRVPIQRPVVAETTVLGAAYLAGIGAGIWSVDDVRQRWLVDVEVTPGEVDEGGYEQWRRAVDRSRSWAT
jgi:glycerol kinase